MRRTRLRPSVPEITDPGFGGNPAIKELGQRADLRPESFEILIKAKGYRLCWNRATRCPCAPTNDQTMQPDPNCTLCDGKGWFWYGDANSQNVDASQQLTASQARILNTTGGYLIRGLMSSMQRNQNPQDKLGHWISGTANLSVSASTRISYFDRLINLDSVTAYSEVVAMPEDKTTPLPTRYIVAGGVYLVRSVATRFAAGEDYEVKSGAIYLTNSRRAPAPGTLLTLHYVCHPAWLVITEPHTTRGTNLLTRQAKPTSFEGSFYDLPMQALVRLEYLPWPGDGNEP